MSITNNTSTIESNKYSKLFIVFIVALTFVSGVSAVGYEFTPSTIDSEALNSHVYLSGLNQSTEYTLTRGDGTTKASFTSTSTGVKNVTFDFTPLADGYTDLTSKGFEYTISDGQSYSENIYLHPSFFIKDFESFNDGTFNSEALNKTYTKIVGGDFEGYTSSSEDQNYAQVYQEAYSDWSWNSRTITRWNLSNNVSRNEQYISWVRITGHQGDGYVKINLRHNGVQETVKSVFVDDNNPTTGYQRFTYYYDGNNDRIVAKFGNQTSTITGITREEYKQSQIVLKTHTVDWCRGCGVKGSYRFKSQAIVPQAYSKYFNIQDTLKYGQNSSNFNAESFNGHLGYTGSLGLEMKKASSSSFSGSLSEFNGVENGLEAETTGKGDLDYLGMDINTYSPPNHGGTTFEPEDWTYRSNVNFETTWTDSDGVIEDVKYDVYAGDAKVVDNRSLSQTDNPDVYETTEGFKIEEEGRNYTVDIKAWDNDGYKNVKTVEQEIPPFETTFAFEDLGTWEDKALTPNVNQTDFDLTWEGFNSSDVNYEYAEIDVYLESLDRDLNETGYDVYLVNKGDIDFINQTDGSDNVNGTFTYNLNFKPLDNYEATNKILGDDIKVIRVLELKEASGNTIKVIKKSSVHTSLEEKSGFFSAVFEAVGSALNAVSGLLGIDTILDGITSIIDGLADTIDNIIGGLEDAITGLLDAISTAIEDLIQLTEDILVEFYIAIAKVIATVVNAVTLFISWIMNVLSIGWFSIANYGLEVEGELDGSNESFTYYNYTGDYDTKLNETSASQMDLILLQYDLNVTHTSGEWATSNNISSTDFNETPIYSFGNVTELRNSTAKTNSTATITVNEYTADYDYPDGIGWWVIALFTVVSAFTAVLNFVYEALPESIKTGISVVLGIGATVIGIITSLLSGLTWILNLLFVDGLKWTIMGVKYYAIFKGLYYFKTIADAMGEGGKDPVTAINIIMDDLKDLYHTVIQLSETAFNISDKIFRQALDIVRTVASWIPFL